MAVVASMQTTRLRGSWLCVISGDNMSHLEWPDPTQGEHYEVKTGNCVCEGCQRRGGVHEVRRRRLRSSSGPLQSAPTPMVFGYPNGKSTLDADETATRCRGAR